MIEWLNNLIGTALFNAPILWLLVGGFLLAVEAFGVPGIGFLFAGLAAILVGVAIEANLIGPDALIAQFALFFIFTSLFAVVLWKKLKQWRIRPEQAEYQNMVGDKAIIIHAGIPKGAVGEVRWSGTVMQAELDETEAAQALAEGTMVQIVKVEGNILKIRQSN